MANNNYHEEQNKQNILKMRAVLAELPPFCRDFFRGIQENTSSRTRLAYAYDIRVFFEYIKNTFPGMQNTDISQFPLSILDQVTRPDIEEYLSYVSFYEKE